MSLDLWLSFEGDGEIACTTKLYGRVQAPTFAELASKANYKFFPVIFRVRIGTYALPQLKIDDPKCGNPDCIRCETESLLLAFKYSCTLLSPDMFRYLILEPAAHDQSTMQYLERYQIYQTIVRSDNLLNRKDTEK